MWATQSFHICERSPMERMARRRRLGQVDEEEEAFYQFAPSDEEEHQDEEEEDQDQKHEHTLHKTHGVFAMMQPLNEQAHQQNEESKLRINMDPKLSPGRLEQHEDRKHKLQAAIDACATCCASSWSAGSTELLEAPFRFRYHATSTMTSPAPTDLTAPGKHSPPGKTKVKHLQPPHEDDDEDEPMEPDGLYDDQMDENDEKYVNDNFRSHLPNGSSAPTDATLNCPCCFLTVCLDCERHVKYFTQYRATHAINCRIHKDKVLVYPSSSSSPASASAANPLGNSLMSSTRTRAVPQGSPSTPLLANEFYQVVCSDCGTQVGVFDHLRQYHFFNVLPSNC